MIIMIIIKIIICIYSRYDYGYISSKELLTAFLNQKHVNTMYIVHGYDQRCMPTTATMPRRNPGTYQSRGKSTITGA